MASLARAVYGRCCARLRYSQLQTATFHTELPHLTATRRNWAMQSPHPVAPVRHCPATCSSRRLPKRWTPGTCTKGHQTYHSRHGAAVYRPLPVALGILAVVAGTQLATEEKEEEEPVYTMDDVAQNSFLLRGIEGPLWVTFRDGVYDVTSFVDQHPGGAQFLLDATGGPIDGFWAYWAYHHVSPKAAQFLQALRIGRLAAEDAALAADVTPHDEYMGDPERPPEQRVLIQFPFNSETFPTALGRSYFTPNDHFYVRNHAPVPLLGSELTPEFKDSFRVTFSADPGLVPDHGDGPQHSQALSLAELEERYPTVDVTSVVQCAGNRAKEMIDRSGKPTAFSGTPYEIIELGMMGNAQWSGVRLSDVLRDVYGLDPDVSDSNLHVVFTGLDGYQTSTPLQHIQDEAHDVLLATHMNGQPLPPDHGFPLRVLIPGVAGARNVKWVSSVHLSGNESAACWQSTYYKDGVDGPSIQGLPMQSLILNATRADDAPGTGTSPVLASGIAWGGSTGNQIESVQVSTDGGTRWVQATVLRDEIPQDDSSKQWGWVRWQANVAAPQRGTTELLCRAVDEAGASQPRINYNPKGYLYNGWHGVTV